MFDFALLFTLSYSVLLLGFAHAPSFLGFNRLGDYSYGIYIYAFPVQQSIAALGVSDPIANIAMSLPITLACAVMSWHVVEKPALRLKSRYRKPLNPVTSER